jgi:hypothetical protein
MFALGPSPPSIILPSVETFKGPRLSAVGRLLPATPPTVQGPETIRFALQVCGVVERNLLLS